MKHIQKLGVLFMAFILVGAGCFAPEPTTPPAQNGGSNGQNGIENGTDGGDGTNEGQTDGNGTGQDGADGQPPDNGTPDGGTDDVELPEIDETWETYTNESLGFSFQWPTRGRYAPEWEVSFVSDNDSAIEGGCYMDPRVKRTDGPPLELEVDGVNFCHTRYVEGAAGNIYYIDYYLGEIKGTNVLFTFTKRLANGDNFEDPNCHGKTVLAVGDTCVPYWEAEHVAHLDQIMETFQVSD